MAQANVATLTLEHYYGYYSKTTLCFLQRPKVAQVLSYNVHSLCYVCYVYVMQS